MDISNDTYKSEIKRPGAFSAVLHAVRSAFRWLAGWISLTEEDQKKAGIYLAGKWYDM